MHAESFATSTTRTVPPPGHLQRPPRGDRTAAPPTPVVFVIDADEAQRSWLRSLVESEGWRVETFPCAAAFLARPRALVPACLVLDVSIPGIDGLALQRQLAARGDLSIIFNTACRDVATSVQAMKAGALDFLTKPAAGGEVMASIRAGLERSRQVLQQESELDVLRARHASLTSRERQVLALVVSGLLNKQVAGELGISEITVKAHRGQVMRKMCADSIADLVTMATRLGLRSLTTH
jgi:FixJ family two-component response regulator